jgi:elongation factor G
LRETIGREVRGERYRYAVATACNSRFADVVIDVEPLAPGSGTELADAREDRSCPVRYVAAFADGVAEALASGPVAGHPVTDVRVVLRSARHHEADSSERGFRLAGAAVVAQAIAKAAPVVADRPGV